MEEARIIWREFAGSEMFARGGLDLMARWREMLTKCGGQEDISLQVVSYSKVENVTCEGSY